MTSIFTMDNIIYFMAYIIIIIIIISLKVPFKCILMITNHN